MAKRRRDSAGRLPQKVPRTDDTNRSPRAPQSRAEAEKGREFPLPEKLINRDEPECTNADRTRKQDLLSDSDTQAGPSEQCTEADVAHRRSDDVERDENDGNISSEDGPADENESDGATTVRDGSAEECEEPGNAALLPDIGTQEAPASGRVMSGVYGAGSGTEGATTVEDESDEECEEPGNKSDGATTVEHELAEEREEFGDAAPLPDTGMQETRESGRVMAGMRGAGSGSEGVMTVEGESVEECEERGNTAPPPDIDTSERLDGAVNKGAGNEHVNHATSTVLNPSALGQPSSPAGRDDISEIAEAKLYFYPKEPRTVGHLKKSQNGGRRLQVARTSRAKEMLIEKWESLQRLPVVRLGQEEDFRPGEIVYIRTNDQKSEPAALLDIRETGDHRQWKEILISWLWDEQAVSKKKKCDGAKEIWRRGVTHFLTNQFAVLPWDTMDDHSHRNDVRMHTKEYLDFRKEEFTLLPSDRLKAMIGCPTLTFIFS